MVLVMVLGLTGFSSAQEKFPSGPIKFIVGAAPGGAPDLQARLIAPFLEKYLGVSVPVENVPGAGNRKARAMVFNSKPDGYIMMINGQPSSCLGEYVFKGEYKSSEFTYIYMLTGKSYSLVFVAENSPVKDYKELVEMSKQKKLKLGTASLGGSDHLAALELKKLTGLQFILVPYDSTAEVIVAVLGNKIDAMIEDLNTAVGRQDLKPLIITAKKRSEFLPNVPTTADLGYPAYEHDYTLGVFGPPKVPEDRRMILEDAFDKAAKDPDYVKRLKDMKVTQNLLKGADYKKFDMEICEMVKTVAPEIEADMTGLGK